MCGSNFYGSDVNPKYAERITSSIHNQIVLKVKTKNLIGSIQNNPV